MTALLSPLFAALLSAVAPRIVVVGGTGRIGTACATHLLRRAPSTIAVELAGRTLAAGRPAVSEVLRDSGAVAEVTPVVLDWHDTPALARALKGADAVIHTAGPFGTEPAVLAAAIDAGVSCYVDVSENVEIISASRALDERARAAGTLAICCAGAFPGLSNVLAMECADRLSGPVHNLDFSYFTSGLGGAGTCNLAITNFGFGTPLALYRGGALSPTPPTGGGNARAVDFPEPVGRSTVWDWPFPEGATVPSQLQISGDSSVGMGTAPELWNVIIGLLVKWVPRDWWLRPAFSSGLARFSQPLVAVADSIFEETHAMRVDATTRDGTRCTATHAHRCFREVVGQCAAEFALCLLRTKGLLPPDEDAEQQQQQQSATDRLTEAAGVFTPEALFATREARAPMLERLLAVEGTTNAGFTLTRL
jgi:putative NADH-flavin reductase